MKVNTASQTAPVLPRRDRDLSRRWTLYSLAATAWGVNGDVQMWEMKGRGRAGRMSTPLPAPFGRRRSQLPAPFAQLILCHLRHFEDTRLIWGALTWGYMTWRDPSRFPLRLCHLLCAVICHFCEEWGDEEPCVASPDVQFVLLLLWLCLRF